MKGVSTNSVSFVRTTQSRPQLAYEIHGSAGQTIVLIQGLGMGRQGWMLQTPTLSQKHRVVAFDNRGVGDSEPVSDWYSVPDLAHDVLRLADEVGFSNFHVVGVSFGGMVAQEVALAAPTRVMSLSLIASHAGGLTAPIPTAKGLLPFLGSALLPKRFRQQHLKKLLLSHVYLQTAKEERVQQRLALTANQPPGVLLRQVWAVARHHTHQRLPQIKIPTLIVRPGRDVLCRPSHSDTLKSLLPHAELAEFPDSGHSVIFEQAEAINQLIQAHVESAASR